MDYQEEKGRGGKGRGRGRVLCWINLATCALRFASLVIAELPLVVPLDLKKKEEEEAENQQDVHEG